MDSNDTEPTEAAPRGMAMRPRDTRRAVARSASYSRIVGVLRWLLPVLVLLVLAVLVILPMVHNQQITTMVAKSVPNLVIDNLHFTGVDTSNQPYSLTAARALQAAGGHNLIDLVKPEGEITLNSGAWLAGKADQGRFDQANKKLWLGGNVQLFHDQGYEFTTSTAQLDLNDNVAWGNEPVLIQGDFGEIRGQGFKVLDGGTVVVIEGHATAQLSLHSAPASDKPAGSDAAAGKAGSP